MLSKEEIEKAKERIQKSLNDIWFGTLYSQEENDEDEKILLQYIEQLEQENNKQNKMIDEMAKVIIASNICDYFIKDNCKYYAGENKKLCDECIKQCFEKKVEVENENYTSNK